MRPVTLPGKCLSGTSQKSPIYCVKFYTFLNGIYCKFFHFQYSGKARSQRVKRQPAKFSDYWDMNIPTEYYEEDFLEFEKEVNVSEKKRLSIMKPEKRSEYMIAKYNASQKFKLREASPKGRKGPGDSKDKMSKRVREYILH